MAATRLPRVFSPFLLAIVLGLACWGQPGGRIDRPNLVVIIGDDHGYPYAGFMGSDVVQTPHLDRLASEGTVFTNAYNVSSTCRPSLMGLLTGLDPYQVKLRGLQLKRIGRAREDVHRILDFRTLPGLLAARGYRSFQAGKHWESSAVAAGFTAGTKTAEHVKSRSFEDMSGGADANALGRTTMEPVWKLLDQAGDDPFLLWFAPRLPHTPLDAPERFAGLYRDKGLSRTAVAYYANVSRLDSVIGELLQRLEEMGVRERTLVLYLSDNGWEQEPEVPAKGRAAILGGARGKMSMYEFGFRTPLVFHWPAHVRAGVVFDELVSTLDVLPTLLDYAGLVPPAGRFGRSLRSAIETGAPVEPRPLYGRMEGALPESVQVATRGARERLREPASFARRDRWHYFCFETKSGEPIPGRRRLYDVEADPRETHDVADEHPEVVAALQREIEDWKRRVRRSLPRGASRMSSWTPGR